MRTKLHTFIQTAPHYLRWIALRNALIAGLVLIPLFLGMDRRISHRLAADARTQVEIQVITIGNNLEHMLLHRLNLVHGLTGFVHGERDHPAIPQNEFEIFAEASMQGLDEIRNLALAPGGVTAYVYPYQENKSVLGYNPAQDEREFVRQEVQRAIETGGVIVSRPYELIQGGLGIIARQAVFIDGKYWGLTNLVLDVPRLLADAGIDPVPANLHLALKDQDGKLFFGDPAVYQQSPLIYTVNLPEGHWELAAVPAEGWPAEYRTQLNFTRSLEIASILFLILIVYLISSRQARLKHLVRRRTLQVESAAEEWRATFDVMSDMVTIHDLDYRIVRANRAAAETFGYQPGDLIGQHCYRIFHQTDCPIDNCPFHHSQHSRQTETSEIWEPTLQKWLHIVSNPLKDESGQVTGTVHVMRDVTERVTAEEEIRRLKIFNENIVQGVTEGIAMQDKSGHFTFVNPALANILGYSQEEMTGMHWTKIVPPDQQAIVELADARRAQGITDRYPLEMLHKNGELVPVQVSGKPHFDGGRSAGMLAVITDMRQRVQAEAERQQLIQTLERRLNDLEILYDSGLALSHLLNPSQIGQQLVDIMAARLQWHHAVIRQYNSQNETFELLAFHVPDGVDSAEEISRRFKRMVPTARQGLSGWAVKQGRSLRIGSLAENPHYASTYSNLQSGLYVPIRRDDHILGVISVESEQLNAFIPDDERLLNTLANQAAAALENARLFQETSQRAEQLEALNKISSALRVAESVEEALPILLDETLAAVDAHDGSIRLYQAETDQLVSMAARGWMKNLSEEHIRPGEGIAGRVFVNGETYISVEFSHDPLARPPEKGAILAGWGGACLPIRVGEETSGVIFVSKPSSKALTHQQTRLLEAIADMAGTALHRMRLHEETARQVKQLRALHRINQAIIASVDLHTTLDILLIEIREQLHVDAVGILLFDAELQMLEYGADLGFKTEAYKQSLVPLGGGYAGRALKERRMIHIPNLAASEKHILPESYYTAEAMHAYWAMPLFAKGKPQGVLEIFRHSAGSEKQSWLDYFKTLASQSAVAIDNARLFDNFQRTHLNLRAAYEATIEGWAHTLELRDKETEGHSRRVVELTLALAKALQINPEQLVHIRRGALLHDIGKMGIPDAVLLKEGPLNEEEWDLMRKHPAFAFDLLSKVDYLRPALDIPFYHHERWDGKGYMHGLQGEEIPLAARIFAIVDVYDALTNERPYRKAWPRQKALEYIREQSGTHFDPQVVNAFLDWMEKG